MELWNTFFCLSQFSRSFDKYVWESCLLLHNGIGQCCDVMRCNFTSTSSLQFLHTTYSEYLKYLRYDNVCAKFYNLSNIVIAENSSGDLTHYWCIYHQVATPIHRRLWQFTDSYHSHDNVARLCDTDSDVGQQINWILVTLWNKRATVFVFV